MYKGLNLVSVLNNASSPQTNVREYMSAYDRCLEYDIKVFVGNLNAVEKLSIHEETFNYRMRLTDIAEAKKREIRFILL